MKLKTWNDSVRIALGFALSIPVLLFVSGCRPWIPEAPRLDPSLLDSDQKRSIDSVERLGTAQVYSMTLYGAYDEKLRDTVHAVLGMGTKDVRGCSTVSAIGSGGKPFFGRNHDFFDSPVLILHTAPPGAYRSVSVTDLSLLHLDSAGVTGLEDDDSRKTLLLYAPFLPCEGMNEKGLVVGTLYTDTADYMGKAVEKEIFSLEALREILDHAATVEEAISVLSGCNIAFPVLPSHIHILDADGDSAIVEFVNGELHAVRDPRRFQIATNFLFTGKEADLAEKRGDFSRTGAVSTDVNGRSYRRYFRAEELLLTHRAVNAGIMMRVLEEISLREVSGDVWMTTQWSTVYDPSTLTASLAASRAYDNLVSFSLIEPATMD